MASMVLDLKSVVTRGYFRKENDDSLWKTYVEYSNNIFYIAKRTDLTYTEYALSHKDVDFILQALTQIWNNGADYEEVTKQSQGKVLRITKQYDNVSFNINKITLLTELTIQDCRKLYAMFKELYICGQTNKLS